MDKIRLANAAEIESIQLGSDITPLSTVVAFENQTTGKPDLAVLRQVFEVDPMVYAAETNTRRKALMIWAIEGALRIQGTIPAYYFNVSAEDDAAEWRANLEHLGAEKLSPTKEFRYKRVL
jgi:hypothetical protein